MSSKIKRALVFAAVFLFFFSAIVVGMAGFMLIAGPIYWPVALFVGAIGAAWCVMLPLALSI